jgi:membrane-associated phospholipid phosphatase
VVYADLMVSLPRVARNALLGAAGVAVMLFATWYAIFHIGAVQRVDASIFDGFAGLEFRPHVEHVAQLIANICDVKPYVFLSVIPIAIALLRRRGLIAGGVVFILVGANTTTHFLKPLLAAPRPDGLPAWVLKEGSWPSGHATASMALALCIVLACPGRLRPYAAAAGAAFAVAVSYSFLTLGWHYPSDALGGFLVAGLWTLIGIAGVSTLDARLSRNREPRTAQLVTAEALTPPAVALCAVLLVVGLAIIVRPDAIVTYASLHTSFVLGAAALGALGLSLATGVMMTLSASGSARGPRAALRRRSRPG